MALITKTKTYVDSDPIIYSDLNANWDALYNLVNGNLDDTNIVSGANINPLKIAGGAVTLINAQTVAGVKTFANELGLTQIATPSNPGSGINKLYVKSDGNVYTLDSSGVETKVNSPSSTSGFGVYLNGAQNVAANNADTKVAFDTKEFDLGTEFDIVTNHRFVAAKAGIYSFTFTAFVQTVPDLGELIAEIFKNGSLAKQSIGNAGGHTNTGVSITATLQLAANDYIEFYLQQSGSSPQALIHSANSTYASGQRLS